MELKIFSQEVNEQLFKVDGRQMSMLEFVDMSVSTHKSRSDEQNFTTVRRGKEIVKIPPVGFRNLLGALSIYAPHLFKDKEVFSRTEDFAKSAIGCRALAYKAEQKRNKEMSRGGEHYL